MSIRENTMLHSVKKNNIIIFVKDYIGFIQFFKDKIQVQIFCIKSKCVKYLKNQFTFLHMIGSFCQNKIIYIYSLFLLVSDLYLLNKHSSSLLNFIINVS